MTLNTEKKEKKNVKQFNLKVKMRRRELSTLRDS